MKDVIIELGHATLRRVAEPIADVGDRDVQKLIDRLLKAVKKANGVGIAAPQMGQSVRLFVVASRPNPRYPNAPEMVPTAMINPRILSKSEQTAKDWEGCLSVPGIRGLVPRSLDVDVEYITRDGQVQRQILKGFVARIFQHELDHLDGIVFLDRVETNRDLISEAEYQSQIVDKRADFE
jgi:peptide deformylase